MIESTYTPAMAHLANIAKMHGQVVRAVASDHILLAVSGLQIDRNPLTGSVSYAPITCLSDPIRTREELHNWLGY